MSLTSKKEYMEDIPIEEDTPKNLDDHFPLDNSNDIKANEVTKDVFNTIKGHNLLGWCVAFLFAVYLFELFKNNGDVSSVGNSIIEIIKLLIFSLTGYLFGTNSNNKDNL